MNKISFDVKYAFSINYTKTKKGNNKQSRFSDVIIMEYHKKDFGKIKLTVGILRGNKEKIQYCITAIEKTTVQPATCTQYLRFILNVKKESPVPSRDFMMFYQLKTMGLIPLSK